MLTGEKRASAEETHSHTYDCYPGYVHIHDGNPTSGGDCYRTYSSGGTCGSYMYSTGNYTTGQIYWTCPSCSTQNIAGGAEHEHYKCNNNHATSRRSNNVIASCSSCGKIMNFGQDSVPSTCTATMPGRWTLSCGKTEGAYYDGDTKVDPICYKVVMGMNVNTQQGTIYLGDVLINTSRVFYLDGSEGEVTCTIRNYDPLKLGTQDIKVTYYGYWVSARNFGNLDADVRINVLDHVTSITPTIGNQTIYYNGSPVKTATIKKASGGIETVECTISNFNPTTIGTQTATLTYKGMTTNKGVYPSCTIQINVQAGLESIIPTYATQTIYKGGTPILSATAKYMDGSTKTVTPTNDFNPNIIGEQNITLSYTDQGVTKTANCKVIIKPNVTSISINKNTDENVPYGTEVTFKITANYEDGTKIENINAALTSTEYSPTTLGKQNITYSYTENGITVTATTDITVYDFPVSIDITLLKDWIYQEQFIEISNAQVTLASGKREEVTPTISNYDNLSVGYKEITFSYSLNGVNVEYIKKIEVKPDLYNITLNKNNFEIYRGQALDIDITANFNVNGDTKLKQDEFTIEAFDNNVYDRNGKYYTVSYTNKDITITKQIFVKILPNITDIAVSVPTQTIEGTHIPFTLKVKYEDGAEKEIKNTDLGTEVAQGLVIEDYELNHVGYQDITFKYTEGGKTVTQVVKIRVRALINISIPLNMLININPNSSDYGESTPKLKIDNESKEPVIVSVQSISKNGESDLKDVMPTKYSDWSMLGLEQSKEIAVGLSCNDNWSTKYLTTPLYVAQINTETDLGVIEKQTSGGMELVIKHGNAHDKQRSFAYSINWRIRLID